MPHAPADQLNALSIETIFSDAGGAVAISQKIGANSTTVFKGQVKPGIYGVYFREDVDQDESAMGKFVVHQAGDNFADVITDAIAATFGAGAGVAVFDTGGAAAAATEVNVTISSAGIMTIITGSSIAAGQLTVWKEVNFPLVII